MSNRSWWKDSYDMMRGSVVVALVIGAIIFAAVAIAGVVGAVNEAGCAQQGEEYGIESDYRFWAGVCYAEVDGHTVNMDNVRENSRGVTIYTPDIKE